MYYYRDWVYNNHNSIVEHWRLMRSKGLDISKWNGRGNWQAVKAAGVDFVIIKAGGVYSATGKSYVDGLLTDHTNGARSVGIPFGLYWFFLPFTPVLNQAQYFMDLIALHKPELPVVVDVESTNGNTAKILSSALKTFITLLQGAGHNVIIYTRQSFWDTNVLPDALWGRCDLWASRWKSSLTSPWGDGYYIFRDWANWKLWQLEGDNNGKAKLYGFPGYPEGDSDIDVNQFNGSVSDLYAWAGLTLAPLTVEERLARLEAAVFGGG